MLLRVEHTFEFGYDGYISESFLELRVQPKPTATQTVASFSLAVGPPTRVFRYRDWNDNLAHHFTVTKFHDRIEIASRSLVETHPVVPPLADAIEKVIDDRVLAQRLGHAGYQRAHELFSIEKNVRELSALVV